MSKNTNLSFLTDFITADIVNSRVGINNASPQTTFDVTGTGKFSGILTLGSTISNGTYAYTLPSATGTLALTSDIPSVSGYVPYTGATQAVNLGYNSLSASFLRVDGAGPTLGSYLGFKHSTNVTTGADGYTSIYTFGTNTIAFKSISGATTRDFSFSMASITPGVPGGRIYTLPDADGTIALTSNIPANPVGGTGTIGTIPVFTGSTTIGNSIIQSNATQVNVVGNGSALIFDSLASSKDGGIGYINDFILNVYNSRGTGSAIQLGNTNLNLITNNTTRLTITDTGAATFNLGSGEMRLNRTGTSEFLKLNTYYLLTDGNDQLLGSVTGSTYIYAGSGVSPKVTIASTGAATFSSSVTAAAGINAIGQQKAFSWQRTAGTASDVYSLNADSASAYLQNDTTSNILMHWLEGGNVGIGTNNPVAALNVVNVPTSFYGIIETTGTSAGTVKHFRVHKPFYVEYGIGILADNSFHISTASTFPTSNGFTMTSGGNVLIGTTTNENGRLQVLGADNAVIAQIKSSLSMLQIYPYFSAYGGPIIQAVDGAAFGYVPLRIEASSTTFNSSVNINGNIDLPSGINRSITLGSVSNYNYRLRTDGDDFVITEAGVTDRLRYSYTNVRWTITGGLTVNGNLVKSSGSFKIDHPLPLKKNTHHLVHSFIEGPQADNIYRGKVQLVNGHAEVNIDESSGMTEGTFVLLNGNVQCFTSNESGWTAIKGRIDSNILTIESEDFNCNDTVSWMVIGERHDQHMIDTDWTDENGKVIVEPLKQ